MHNIKTKVEIHCTSKADATYAHDGRILHGIDVAAWESILDCHKRNGRIAGLCSAP